MSLMPLSSFSSDELLALTRTVTEKFAFWKVCAMTIGENYSTDEKKWKAKVKETVHLKSGMRQRELRQRKFVTCFLWASAAPLGL